MPWLCSSTTHVEDPLCQGSYLPARSSKLPEHPCLPLMPFAFSLNPCLPTILSRTIQEAMTQCLAWMGTQEDLPSGLHLFLPPAGCGPLADSAGHYQGSKSVPGFDLAWGNIF